MNDRILICTDLDRTLLPNGDQPESPGARDRFARLAQHPGVDIAYVTGRHQALVLDAIDRYTIPVPDFVIGDVGSSIYAIEDGRWRPLKAWQDQIAPDWQGCDHDALADLLADIAALRLQEPEKQNVFKLSYYAPEDTDSDCLRAAMQARLQPHGIHASLIWSIDDLAHVGLLDVLPQQATKRHAIEFLMENQGYAHQHTVFAGDSGNDIPVLASPIQSVLVANARTEVREQALALAARNGCADALYIATGGFLDMNGNYAAGIVEGVVHYLPQARDWLAG